MPPIRKTTWSVPKMPATEHRHTHALACACGALGDFNLPLTAMHTRPALRVRVDCGWIRYPIIANTCGLLSYFVH